MRILRILAIAVATSFALSAHAPDKTAPLTEAQKTFLNQYESVRASLAADDLPTAKKSAAALVTASQPASKEVEPMPAYLEAAKKIADAESLDAAREGFKSLSKRAVHLAEGKAGYFHAHCPMVPNEEGDWVQTTKKSTIRISEKRC